MDKLFNYKPYEDLLRLLCNYKIVKRSTLAKVVSGNKNKLNIIIRVLQRKGFNIKRIKLSTNNNIKYNTHNVCEVYTLEQNSIK